MGRTMLSVIVRDELPQVEYQHFMYFFVFYNAVRSISNIKFQYEPQHTQTAAGIRNYPLTTICSLFRFQVHWGGGGGEHP